MRTSDLLLVLGALGSAGIACATKVSPEATKVLAPPSRASGEASCRHEFGRCGGHKPGDGACGGAREPVPSVQPLGEVTLEPGKFAEINLEMGEGAAIEVHYDGAGGSLEWNVHSHKGDEVVVHNEGTGTEGSVKFAAPHPGLYSYLWKNVGSTPVRLTTRLTPSGSVRIHSAHPLP